MIERTLKDGLAKGDLTLMRLANQMGLSVRTVQRRLRAAGLTHRELVRGLRHKLARQSLDAPISQGQIARSLGLLRHGRLPAGFQALVWDRAGATSRASRQSPPPSRRRRQKLPNSGTIADCDDR